MQIDHERHLRCRCASTFIKRYQAAWPSSQSTARRLDFHRYIFSFKFRAQLASR
jgi:hypothetical protein